MLVPPPVLGALAHHPLVDSFDLSSLRVIGSGGAPASAELERAVAERLGCIVGQGYGMTEAGPMIAAPMTDPPVVRPGSVGRLVPGTEARIVDGEVWVRGPQLMSGYVGDPVATAARSTTTAGCTPATPAASTTRASCTSATASRS